MLDDEKKRIDESNEDLERQLKAKEEANLKRLLAKLQKDKNPEIKELIAKEEQQQQDNEEQANKFREEREKHDQLLDDLIQLRETLKLTKEQFDTTTENLKVQDEDLTALKATIDTKQKDVNAKLKVVEEARKVKLQEKERNRTYAKANAALKAKLEFIEAKYDFTSSAKNLSVQDFKELIDSNKNINETMEGFHVKLSDVKREIREYETLRSTQIQL